MIMIKILHMPLTFRANGSLRFELQAPVSAGLKGGMDLLTVNLRSKQSLCIANDY